MSPQDQRRVRHHHGNRTEQGSDLRRKLKIVAIGTNGEENGEVGFNSDLSNKNWFLACTSETNSDVTFK